MEQELKNLDLSEKLEFFDESTTKEQAFERTEYHFRLKFEDEKVKYRCQSWKPINCARPKVLVYVCHGFAEYLGFTYEEFIHKMVPQGDAVAFGHDHLGHGHTGGDRAQSVYGYPRDFVRPVLLHCQEMQSRYPDVPLYIVGHSMGGMITLLSLIAKQDMFKGAVFIGPMIVVDPELATRFNIWACTLLRYIAPNFGIQPLETEKVTRDEKMVEKMKNDVLQFHGSIKAKMGYYGLCATQAAPALFPQVKIPIYVQHGEKDLICRSEGSKQLINEASSIDRTIKIYPGAFHSLYIETQETRDKAVQDTIDWITVRAEDHQPKQ